MKQGPNATTPCRAFILACIFCTGCHTYYKAQTVTPTAGNHAEQKLDSLKLVKRYFILREGSHAYYMDQIQLSADHKIITCVLDTLAPEHKLHLERGMNHHLRYKKHNPDHLGVLNEVHLYIQPDSPLTLGPYSLQLDQVQKIEVLQKDPKRTANSYVLGTLGFTAGVAVLVTAIVAATYSSYR